MNSKQEYQWRYAADLHSTATKIAESMVRGAFTDSGVQLQRHKEWSAAVGEIALAMAAAIVDGARKRAGYEYPVEPGDRRTP